MRGLLLFVLGLVLISGTKADQVSYATKLFDEITRETRGENVIFSPTSIKSALGLAFMGAEDATAKELYDLLQLTGTTKEAVGEHFVEYFNKFKDSGVDLKTANRVYFADRLTLAPKFTDYITKYFDSTAEKINFAASAAAAKSINTWVEGQTNNKIHDLVSPDAFDSLTAAVLVNAIYFKANWRYQFKPEKVQDRDFYLTKEKTTPVKMMRESLNIRYGDLPDLNARAIELPYSNTDVHMLVILPNEIDGLAALEERLKTTDITNLPLQREKVNLQFPKFKFEFSIVLNDVLKKLGLEHVFSNANFNAVTTNNEDLDISSVLHKAFIEVDETGTEAAGATAAVLLSRTLPLSRDLSFDFFVNHPFFFAIKNRDTVYFAGHVAKF